MKKIVTTIGIAALASVPAFVGAADMPEFTQSISTSAPVKVSKPLRELAKPLPTLSKARKFKMMASGDEVPGYGKTKEIPNRFPFKNRVYQQSKDFVDNSAQTSLKKRDIARLADQDIGVSFEGVGNVFGVAPPDTNGEVGPNHYVQTVNLAMAVWDKEGNQLMAPTATNALWAGFGGLCETNNDGDPIVLYDSAADRWLISQFALDGTNNHECIAISTTGDPTGSYFLYDFTYGELMNDYPKLGIWNDGYYMGVNQFDSTNGFSFEGGAVVAFERDKMLTGAEAQQVKFDSSSNGDVTVFTPMPLDMDGFAPPPADAKEYFIWSSLDSLDNLQVWEFDVNWADPAASTFEQVTEIAVTPYSSAPAITQPNGSSLDSLSIRSMFRAAYRNLDGQGKIVFTHNIAAPAGQGETALRWYEIDVDQVAGTATLAQESTFAPDQESRWMGSGAMDANGNIAFGYSIASANMLPSIAAATRLVTDPANTLTDETILKAGEASQSGLSRWGDYSNLSVDPVDDCTFWFTTEYYKADDNNSSAWSTYVSSFKIPTCTAGPRGEVSGSVTDADTGGAVAFATVSAGAITTRADAEGNFIITLPIGDYGLTATKYGWDTNTPVDVTVIEDDTVAGNISLAGSTPVVVSGTIADTDGTGVPLYAKISVSVPGDTIVTFTNPETGAYSVNLFEGTTVSVTADEIGVGGFLPATQDILPSNEEPTIRAHDAFDFDLDVNSNCTAPGYDFVDPAFYEGFDIFPATGWTITDDAGDGVLWTSYLASGRNLATVETDAALGDSDAPGSGNTVDTSLISPSINVADLSTLVLEFDGYFRPLGSSEVTVDLSADGGAWTNIGSINPDRSYDPYAFDLTADLAGVTSFQIRFRYTAGWDWYTIVDNVRFGNRSCEVVAPGTMQSTYVNDVNTGLALNGAQVSLDGVLAAIATSTDADDSLNDGFVQVYVPDTTESIAVTYPAYETANPTAAEMTLATPVNLNAGRLSIAPESLESMMTAGRSSADTLSVTNSGSATATFNSFFIKGDPQNLINGPFDPSARHFGPKNLNDLTAEKTRFVADTSDIPALAPGEIVGFFPTNIAYGWGISRNRVTGEFWVGDLAAGGAAADLTWRYDAGGNLTGDAIDSNFGGVFHADSAFNQRTGMLWSVNVGGDNCIYELDTEALVQTGNTICPAFAVSQRGLAYDPVTDTFYSGSWTDSIIHQFTTDGTLIRSVNVGLSIAGLAFNAETNHLFISVNGVSGDGDFDIVVVNAASPSFVKVGGYDITLDVDGDGVGDDVIQDNGQAGLDIDCNGNLWITEQNQQFVVGFESGETGVCEWNNVPWLSVDSTSADIEVGTTTDVAVSFDSAGMDAGTYTASIVYANNTPYGSTSVPVTMTLNEPDYGVFGFEVSSVEVTEEGVAVISVSRTGGADYAVSVDYSTQNGSATTIDYTAASGTLSWTDLDSRSQTFSVRVGNVDQDKSLSVVLSNAQGGATIGGQTVAIVTIKKKSDSGSLGVTLLALFAFGGLLRRRQLKK